MSCTRSWIDLPEGVADIEDVFDAEGRFVRQAMIRKDISPEDDYIFYCGNRVLISIAGVSANLVSVGAALETRGSSDIGELRLPTAIWCEMVLVQ